MYTHVTTFKAIVKESYKIRSCDLPPIYKRKKNEQNKRKYHKFKNIFQLCVFWMNHKATNNDDDIEYYTWSVTANWSLQLILNINIKRLTLQKEWINIQNDVRTSKIKSIIDWLQACSTHNHNQSESISLAKSYFVPLIPQ